MNSEPTNTLAIMNELRENFIIYRIQATLLSYMFLVTQ